MLRGRVVVAAHRSDSNDCRTLRCARLSMVPRSSARSRANSLNIVRSLQGKALAHVFVSRVRSVHSRTGVRRGLGHSSHANQDALVPRTVRAGQARRRRRGRGAGPSPIPHAAACTLRQRATGTTTGTLRTYHQTLSVSPALVISSHRSQTQRRPHARRKPGTTDTSKRQPRASEHECRLPRRHLALAARSSRA